MIIYSYMKLVISLCLFSVSLFSHSYVDISKQVVEYQIDESKYAVVVVQDGVSLAEARKTARQRAAEVAFEQGYRYYVIETELQTEIIRAERPEGQGFFGDMYQELIIEEQFHKDRLAAEATSNEGMHLALRLVFSCYKEKPSGASIDICTTGKCD